MASHFTCVLSEVFQSLRLRAFRSFVSDKRLETPQFSPNDDVVLECSVDTESTEDPLERLFCQELLSSLPGMDEER